MQSIMEKISLWNLECWEEPSEDKTYLADLNGQKLQEEK